MIAITETLNFFSALTSLTCEVGSTLVKGLAHVVAGPPVIDCSVEDRKHEMAEEVLRHTKRTPGLFLILVSRAPGPVWEVRRRHHLERKKPMTISIITRFIFSTPTGGM